MANSGTVGPTSSVVYTQFNGLRSDVLDPTTGHIHSGSTDGGRQLSGPCLGSVSGTPLFSGTATFGAIISNKTMVQAYQAGGALDTAFQNTSGSAQMHNVSVALSDGDGVLVKIGSSNPRIYSFNKSPILMIIRV